MCGKKLMTGVAFVLGCRHRHPVGDGVATDDSAASMNAGATHCAFEHLGVFYGVGKQRVGTCLGVAKLGHALDGVGQVHL